MLTRKAKLTDAHGISSLLAGFIVWESINVRKFLKFRTQNLISGNAYATILAGVWGRVCIETRVYTVSSSFQIVARWIVDEITCKNRKNVPNKSFENFLDRLFPITVAGVATEFIVALCVFVTDIEIWLRAFVFVQDFNALWIDVDFPAARGLRLVRKVDCSFYPSGNGFWKLTFNLLSRLENRFPVPVDFVRACCCFFQSNSHFKGNPTCHVIELDDICFDKIDQRRIQQVRHVNF